MRQRMRDTWDNYSKPRKWSGDQGGWGISARPLLILALWWLWGPAVYLLCQVIIHFAHGIGTWSQSWHLFWVGITAGDAGVWGMSPWFWLWLCIGLVGSAVIVGFFDSDDMSYGEMGITILSVVTALITIFPISAGFHDSDKDEAYFYLQSTTVHLVDLANPPSSLQLLFLQKDAAKVQDGNVLHIGYPARVVQGSLPTNEWLKRNSSFDGAKNSLHQKTGVQSGVDIFDETITYAYGNSRDASGQFTNNGDRWTAVLDGSKYEIHTAGVAEWRGGENVAHICRFDTDPNGSYRFTRAFDGGHENSLTNVLALEYPDLMYEDQDIAGYCDSADKPVIIISVTRYVGWRASVYKVPAGILVLKGSPTGHPHIEYKPEVEAGEYPVPVYPLSIAKLQREQQKWLAGRGNMENADFGFEPSNFSSQAGNSGEYVLRNKSTGQIVAYTPLTAQASSSQLYIDHTEIALDNVHNGRLNDFDSYFLPDTPTDGHKIVDPQSLDSLAQRLVQRAPTFENFISSGGKLREYVPTGRNTFRGYGEDKNGATILYIDLDYDQTQSVKATVVTLDPNSGREIGSTEVSLDTSTPQGGVTGTPQSGGSPSVTCNGKNVKVVTVQEIEACLRAYQDELIRRLASSQATPATTPTPTSSPTPAITK